MLLCVGAVEALAEMGVLFELLAAMRGLANVSFDLSLARGLDYYTGAIYEAVLKSNTLDVEGKAMHVGSVAAGGRCALAWVWHPAAPPRLPACLWQAAWKLFAMRRSHFVANLGCLQSSDFHLCWQLRPARHSSLASVQLPPYRALGNHSIACTI
jgi:hypothetical protein